MNIILSNLNILEATTIENLKTQKRRFKRTNTISYILLALMSLFGVLLVYCLANNIYLSCYAKEPILMLFTIIFLIPISFGSLWIIKYTFRLVIEESRKANKVKENLEKSNLFFTILKEYVDGKIDIYDYNPYTNILSFYVKNAPKKELTLVETPLNIEIKEHESPLYLNDENQIETILNFDNLTFTTLPQKVEKEDKS